MVNQQIELMINPKSRTHHGSSGNTFSYKQQSLGTVKNEENLVSWITRSLEAGQGHSGSFEQLGHSLQNPVLPSFQDCRLQLVAGPVLAASCPKGASAEDSIQRQRKGGSPLLKCEETFLTSPRTDNFLHHIGPN